MSMRHTLQHLAVAVSIILLLAARAQAAQVTAVDSISIPVSDPERAAVFYTEVLGFRRVAERNIAGDAYEHLFGVFGFRARAIRLQLGDEAIELIAVETPAGRPLPVDFRSNDRWFQHIAIITSDMNRAYVWLESHHVRHASTQPQTLPDWNPNAGGIAAYYFKDPDGNHLEILHFPPGKGAAKWQAGKALFLGIDHTAIVVADSDASVAFYRDQMGFAIAGHSDNYGPEQEHLNNVFGAHLRITALRTATGPGVELLEYLAPRTGREYPADSTAADRWQWTINLRTTDPLQPDPHWHWVSSYPVNLPDSALGFSQGFILRDPDGHALNLELKR